MSDEKTHIARRIVDRIIADMCERISYRRGVWEEIIINEDSQTHIRSAWEQIAESELRA